MPVPLSEVFSRSPDREIGPYSLVDAETAHGRQIVGASAAMAYAVGTGKILDQELEAADKADDLHRAHPSQFKRDAGTGKFSFEYNGQRIEFRDFGDLMNIGRSYDTVAEKVGLVAAYAKKFTEYQEDTSIPQSEKRKGPASAIPYDYYKTPRSFLESGTGDCEDYAHGYRRLLNGMGVPEDRMLAVHVLAPVNSILNPDEKMVANHVFLAVKNEKGEYHRLDVGGKHEHGRLENMMKSEGFVPLYARTAGHTYVLNNPAGPTPYEQKAFEGAAKVVAMGAAILVEGPDAENVCKGMSRFKNDDFCTARDVVFDAVQRPAVPNLGAGVMERPH